MTESVREHLPVMVEEMERNLIGEALDSVPAIYCDCTAGSGGYALRILERDRSSTVVAMDRDDRALDRCRRRLRGFRSRVQYFHGGFSRIAEAVAEHPPLAGIVADLGFSAEQVHDPDRGFSFRAEGPLDMRFDRRQELRAADVVNRGGEREFANLLFELADERFSRRIARAVVRARPVRDTRHLADIVAAAVPRGAYGRIHPATRTFQALRMVVNDERGELATLLETAPPLLASGGRFVVVSFHSGEDRMVKHSFRRRVSDGKFRLLTRRALLPSSEEVVRNPPCRSARMRALCRAAGWMAESKRIGAHGEED